MDVLLHPCVAIDHAECPRLSLASPLGLLICVPAFLGSGAVVVSHPSASAGVGSCGGGGTAVCLPLFSRKFVVLV